MNTPKSKAKTGMEEFWEYSLVKEKCMNTPKDNAEKEYWEYALEMAALSKCTKRKVGAVIVAEDGQYIGSTNYHPDGKPCELDGKTSSEVIHAEVAALNRYLNIATTPIKNVYVTHPPCKGCLRELAAQGVTSDMIIIVTEHMKFDSGKPRYSLIPTEATKALAEVLTYGAKKYKDNNWQQGTPDRYTDALYRHLEAWREGEKVDSDSGLSHLSHAITNVAFLIYLTEKQDK